jgi:hypothetical protein
MIYLHPVLGGCAVALMLWLGAQGIRARHPRPYAPASRRRHRAVGKTSMVLVVLAACTGAASVHFLRSDLELSRSLHFWLGTGAALCMAGLAWTGPQIHQDPDSKRLHPVMGWTALVVGALTATLGMGLLP